MPLGALLERSWGALGRSWDALGVVLAVLGQALMLLRALLGCSWTDLGPSWPSLGRYPGATSAIEIDDGKRDQAKASPSSCVPVLYSKKIVVHSFLAR